jgi:hypothetical protein
MGTAASTTNEQNLIKNRSEVRTGSNAGFAPAVCADLRSRAHKGPGMLGATGWPHIG